MVQLALLELLVLLGQQALVDLKVLPEPLGHKVLLVP